MNMGMIKASPARGGFGVNAIYGSKRGAVAAANCVPDSGCDLISALFGHESTQKERQQHQQESDDVGRGKPGEHGSQGKG